MQVQAETQVYYINTNKFISGGRCVIDISVNTPLREIDNRPVRPPFWTSSMMKGFKAAAAWVRKELRKYVL